MKIRISTHEPKGTSRYVDCGAVLIIAEPVTVRHAEDLAFLALSAFFRDFAKQGRHDEARAAGVAAVAAVLGVQ